jgi:hypothetical protein
MGKQYNKTQKRQRRKRYLKRKKAIMHEQLELFKCETKRDAVPQNVKKVVNFFISQPDFKSKINSCFEETIKGVLDLFRKGQINELDQTQKAVMGSAFEENVRAKFNLAHGDKHKGTSGNLDYKIDSLCFDVKFSLKNTYWIPPSCVNQVCALATENYPDGKRQFGVFLAKEKYLNKGANRDKKRTISTKNYKYIKWLNI